MLYYITIFILNKILILLNNYFSIYINNVQEIKFKLKNEKQSEDTAIPEETNSKC